MKEREESLLQEGKAHKEGEQMKDVNLFLFFLFYFQFKI